MPARHNYTLQNFDKVLVIMLHKSSADHWRQVKKLSVFTFASHYFVPSMDRVKMVTVMCLNASKHLQFYRVWLNSFPQFAVATTVQSSWHRTPYLPSSCLHITLSIVGDLPALPSTHHTATRASPVPARPRWEALITAEVPPGDPGLWPNCPLWDIHLTTCPTGIICLPPTVPLRFHPRDDLASKITSYL